MGLLKNRQTDAMQGEVDHPVDSVSESSAGARTTSPGIQRANVRIRLSTARVADDSLPSVGCTALPNSLHVT